MLDLRVTSGLVSLLALLPAMDSREFSHGR